MSVFLSVLGGKTYTLLRNLLAPAKPKEQTLAHLSTTLKNNFEPKRVVMAERFHFYHQDQTAGETIAEYIAELRRQSTHCEFDTALGMEAAGRNSQQLKGSNSVAVQRVSGSRTSPNTRPKRKVCYHCACPYKDVQCHYCGKLGHLASVC